MEDIIPTWLKDKGFPREDTDLLKESSRENKILEISLMVKFLPSALNL